MPTCKCGKSIKDKRGMKGHVKFKEDDTHGEKGEIPDNWRSFFDAAGDEEIEDEDDGEGKDEDNASRARAREKGKVRRLLTTPINELL